MKRAMHLARKSSKPESLTRIVHFILDLYRAKSSESLTSRNYLLSEMLFWIGQGKAKFPDISRSISDLCKYNADGMLDFITFLLNDKDSNSASNKTLISSCIDALKHWQGKRGGYEDRIKECDDKLKILSSSVTVTPDSERTAQYTVPDIVMPFSIDAKIQHSKFKYDFFVSHSNVNRDWVNNYLLHQLETKLHDNDIAFKGCIADRDFTPGNTIIDNIIDAVKHSCKIIFVITADFITSRWCDFEVDKALIEMLSTKKKEDCIIPILLEKITDQSFPEKLGHITYLDLTDESKRFEEVMKLKRALSIQLD
ncbi:hypothetical protein KUTeg_009352 [Tegillarca granosa]|uniref:TIR domain-containing protein n=1 Tax=Tegillarca granosa TaxID=220873 RepID=A0ABQ9F3K5_TEGGR|nr:hypothetical protein KUTeg_009352 [Tegillarca granosa]